MNQSELKQRVAEAAVDWIGRYETIGLGTGSTVNKLINALHVQGKLPERVVSSSKETTDKLHRLGVEVCSLNEVGTIDLYVDGADEVTGARHLSKGGGGALTLEKILAQSARTFLCLVDETKHVAVLGRGHPIVLEVISEASGAIARACVAMGGHPNYRPGLSEHGHRLIDVYQLDCTDPEVIEHQLNQLPGLITCGLFIQQRPDHVMIGTQSGIMSLT